MHVRWISFMQHFIFAIKHKSRKLNRVTNALNRKIAYLVNLHPEITSFGNLKELCAKDDDFSEEYISCMFG